MDVYLQEKNVSLKVCVIQTAVLIAIMLQIGLTIILPRAIEIL